MNRLGDQRAVLPDYPGSVIAVRRDWAAANRDDLVRYLRVWSNAGQLASAEPDAAADAYARAVNLPAAAARRLLPGAFNAGTLNIPGLQGVLDLRNQFGYQLPMGPRLGVYYDASYYQAATASK